MSAASPTAPVAAEHPKESIKETLISIIIAFVLAFVFRGFVIEAFVIPTGSMAPTLLGQHMRFQGDQSDYNWPVGPWYYPGNDQEEPKSVQGLSPDPAVLVHDPMTGRAITESEGRNIPILAGDRILVLKYLYGLREPERFDVVVFKTPTQPSVNYIKRLVGLPGEQLALVDGDVFYRRPAPALTNEDGGPQTSTWDEPGWSIARKPDRIAKAVWQNVFDSSFSPLKPVDDRGRWFHPPWQGDKWLIEDRRDYQFTGSGATRLSWNDQAEFTFDKAFNARMNWEINDRYPFDETNPFRFRSVPDKSVTYPVSDIRLRAGIETAWTSTTSVSPTIEARGHQFRAVLASPQASVQMRPMPSATDPDPKWTTLGSGPFDPAAYPKIINVEFWHIDQSLSLFVEGHLIARGVYDWSPAQRIAFATGKPLAELIHQHGNAMDEQVLAAPSIYRKPKVWWDFSTGPVTLYHVGLDRDLHYQPGSGSYTAPRAVLRAAHPSTTMNLGPDQFFVCGDNSPASSDARLWNSVDDWVANRIDPTIGVVPRDLMLGKAFFVYFPALASQTPPVPDIGRMRFIR